ncbi:MAG: hypothetical protein NUW37_17665 [Planctomycetes bacterium]|nr:hypothetical protein [Planctomycetota bacterium]
MLGMLESVRDRNPGFRFEWQPRREELPFVPDFLAKSADGTERFIFVTSSEVVRSSDSKFWETAGEIEFLRRAIPEAAAIAILLGSRQGWKKFMAEGWDLVADRTLRFFDPFSPGEAELSEFERAVTETLPRSSELRTRETVRARKPPAKKAPTDFYRVARSLLLIPVDELRKLLGSRLRFDEGDFRERFPSLSRLAGAKWIPERQKPVIFENDLLAEYRASSALIRFRETFTPFDLEAIREAAESRAPAGFRRVRDFLSGGEAGTEFDRERFRARLSKVARSKNPAKSLIAFDRESEGGLRSGIVASGFAPNEVISKLDARHRAKEGRHLFYPPNFVSGMKFTDAQALALATELLSLLESNAQPESHGSRVLAHDFESWYKHPASNPLALLVGEKLSREGYLHCGISGTSRGVLADTTISRSLPGNSASGKALFHFAVESDSGATLLVKLVTAYEDVTHRVKELWGKLPSVLRVDDRARICVVSDGGWSAGAGERWRDSIENMGAHVFGVSSLESTWELDRWLLENGARKI